MVQVQSVIGAGVLFTLTFDSSPIKETFAKPTVIPAQAGIYSQSATREIENLGLLSPFH